MNQATNNRPVRVRFAPSPTGGLHLGGVRTILFNYLFARQHGGKFILRIEDTDRNRFVEGAEEYINDTLKWSGLLPDESPFTGGEFGPYRQSERKELYREYAERLVAEGHAYYAFDTPEELERMRTEMKTEENPNPQYDHRIRGRMRNSLSLPAEEAGRLKDAPHVIRIKMPEDEAIAFTDMIRGEVSFQAGQSDDKVLIKADGMPTYHLAVVVDDCLMKISHAFRGEEWLPSAPVHILLWKWLFGLDAMPEWAHLPLILKPDGNGKLSKRDGQRLGFPVFALEWKDPRTGETVGGFREAGFLPEAFLNMLVLLGWNDGTDQEIYTLDEMIAAFSMQRVHKGGAKFDYEKAKWFNHEWIKRLPVGCYAERVKELFAQAGFELSDEVFFLRALEIVKDRCTLLNDFVQQAGFFFQRSESPDVAAVSGKWDDHKKQFFAELVRAFGLLPAWDHDSLEACFKEVSAAARLKPGELMLPLRIMLVGGKFGPGVFDIAAILGREETIARIRQFPLMQ